MRKERTKPQSEWMAKKYPYFDGIDQYGRPITECFILGQIDVMEKDTNAIN